jgi:MYXO-CTERM domain-containing protein
MVRATTIGACVALALVAAGSVDAVRAQNVCCLSLCNGGGQPDCSVQPPDVCGGVCAIFCAFNGGCAGTEETGCLADQSVVGCGGPSCAPTCVANTPTSTPTHTPTATSTPTNTPVPQGGACATPAQCSTGFCVDSVCCDTACTDPSKRCDLTNRVGTCASTTAPAPALTPWGLLAAALALAGFGAFTLQRRLRNR